MRLATALALSTLALTAHAQSINFKLVPEAIPFAVQANGFAPNSSVQGVSIIRSQKDFDAFWAANNGMAAIKGTIAPWKLDFSEQQLIAVVLPKHFQFDALPTVTCVETSGRRSWRIEVAPTRGFVRQGSGQMVPYVLILTPIGPNSLDITVRDPDGRPVFTLRARSKD